jgi:hypothetical protein
LFETGEREEERIIANLIEVGVTVEGRQEEVSFCDGHMLGHLDGVVLGLLEAPKTWHVLEVKTHSTKSFADLTKNGVKKSKPAHYAQMQLYMDGLGLERACYLAQNKDTDELHLERVEREPAYIKALIAKANAIIYADSPPDRIGDASYYLCKHCDYSDVCHSAIWPQVNCRTCAHSTPVADGKWSCARGLVVGRPSCAEHIYLPTMIHWDEAVDGCETWVRYRSGLVNCAATGFPTSGKDYRSSRELYASTLSAPGR